MAIDFERDEQLVEQDLTQQVKRRLPIPDLAAAAGALEYEASEAEQVIPTVAESAKEGFAGGFVDGLRETAPLAALAGVADSAERGLAAEAASVQERMLRFPELRDVQAATGVAARFPELATQPVVAAVEEVVQEGGFHL